MNLKNLIVSFALLLPVTFTNAPVFQMGGTPLLSATSPVGPTNPPAPPPPPAPMLEPADHMNMAERLETFVIEIAFDPSLYGFPGMFTPPAPGPRNGIRPMIGLTPVKPFRGPLGLLPPPNLDASVQLVVGPMGTSSQGTLVCLPGEGLVIVTHDHFYTPLNTEDDLYFKEHLEDYFTGHVDMRVNKPESTRYQEVNIIPLGEDCIPLTEVAVSMAAPESIGEIQVGDWVQVVYNAGTKPGQFILKYASMQVVEITHTTIQVHDPDNLINKGDSGGAVYFDDELIGVLWSIATYDYGPGVNVSLVRAP